MDELRKASILLKHLSPAEREQILGQFEPEQRAQLERTVGEASDVTHSELAAIVSEYQTWLQRVSSGKNTEQEPSATAESGGNSATETEPRRTWQSLSQDAGTISKCLIDEPATVLAAVLCQLEESTAHELYAALSEDRKGAVVARLAAQRELTPLVKQELTGFLCEAVSGNQRDNQRGSALLARLVGS